MWRLRVLVWNRIERRDVPTRIAQECKVPAVVDGEDKQDIRPVRGADV